MINIFFFPGAKTACCEEASELFSISFEEQWDQVLLIPSDQLEDEKLSS